MNKNELEFLFRIECRQHKIQDARFVWSESPRQGVLALCHASKDLIEFFGTCEFLSYGKAIETIRHELAHLLDYRETGGWKKTPSGRNDFHGKSWKRFCAQLGCRARTQIPRSEWGF